MYPGATLWLLLTLLATTQAANNPEVSWGDWIIVDEAEPGTSILLRRITPKSVFVAPTFNGCSEGYRQDSLGRCVKLVKVNQQAQWNFFLERLNSMYAPSSTSKKPQKEQGPFHINLPIGSESSQEEVVINKRVPPKIRDESVKTTRSTTQPTTVTTTLLPSTTTAPVKTMIESSTPEVLSYTTVDTPEAASTIRGLNAQADSATETRRDVATENYYNAALMLGDQPASTEDFTEQGTPGTPKNRQENPSQLREKPFVIIVTNEPTTRTETTTNNPTYLMPSATEEGEVDTGETSSTTEVTTEGTSESTLRYTTETTLRTTDYDENFSETRDRIESSIRPTFKFSVPSTMRPKCDPTVTQIDDLSESSDCDPVEGEIVSDEREATKPSVSLPASLPLLEPNSHVRFPTESFVPARKTQSFVRFPDTNYPHDERPSFWWPSWQIQQHPGIRGWPPSEDRATQDQMIHKQYPPYRQPGHSWSDSNAWRRRFFQRD